jgi:hypothetical protein
MSCDLERQSVSEASQTDRNHGNAAGYGSKRLCTDCGDNVGKGHLPAGADSNLQRPAE